MRALFRHTKKIFRVFFLIASFLMLLLLGFHFWFIYHSEKTIEDLITWASNGKLKSSIKKFKIDYRNNNIDIKELTIFNTDSLDQSTSYRFSTKDFHLRIRSRWALIFHKKLLIDSVVFKSPDIVVTRKGPRLKDTTNKKLLLAEELGNVYKAISNSLTVLNLQRFEIFEGKVLIRDREDNKKPPFRLSHIFLSIDKLNIDSTSRLDSSHFIFSDRILLRVSNQNILLPDGKSSVSFSELLIDSKEKLIRVRRPMVSILPLPGQQSSFTAAAQSLNITGLDFNELYQKQLIKADSVLIISPDGKLELYTGEKARNINNKKRTPIDSALLQLPLAININHLVLLHGDGLMHLWQPGKMTTFQTKNDNLSILGLRINDSSGNPLSIAGFNYTIRNYIGYTPDSIYRLHFDSLQFTDNKILLYNFKASTFKKTKTTLIREYAVPRFEISGMDWFSFIFDNHFIARSAVLYNAVLQVEKNDFLPGEGVPENRNKRSIYQTLSVMDSILDLEQLQIVNGDFSYRIGNSLKINLLRLNLSINADELTHAKSINQILESVKQLSFDTATISNATASLFVGNSKFDYQAKSLALEAVKLDMDKSLIKANFNGVAINDFSFDNNELEVNGFQWRNGIIHISAPEEKREKLNLGKGSTAFLLRNISGNNSALFLENKNMAAELYLKTLSANQIRKESGKTFEITGMMATGDKAILSLPDTRIQCSGFRIEDERNSLLENIIFAKYSKTDSVLIHLPVLGFIPFFNKSNEKETILADSVVIKQPSLFLSRRKTDSEKKEDAKPFQLPAILINRMGIENASIELHIRNGINNSVLESRDINLRIDKISTGDDHALLISRALVQDAGCLFSPNNRTTVKSSPNTWIGLHSVWVQPLGNTWGFRLDSCNADSIQYTSRISGQQASQLTMDNIRIESLTAGNQDMKKPLPWLFNHSAAVFRFGLIRWKDEQANLGIRDIQFSQPTGKLKMDSVWVDPGKTRDEFISAIEYRKDYLQGNSGRIEADGMQMLGDTLLIAHVAVENAVLSIYSDKLKKPGVESLESLPVGILKKISLPVQVGQVALKNMQVDYAELNEDTKRTGRVFFSNINGTVSHINSKPRSGYDSLVLRVRADFLDSIAIHLALEESYSDPLEGLRLQIQLGRGDLRLLNPFLAPLVSVRAVSGYLDTLSMTATGNEFQSQGRMLMYYHGLHAEILDSGNLQKRRFGTKLLGFVANTFAIRNQNSQRVAIFKFFRMRKKSAISYFLKMVVQGVSGSVAPLSKILYRKEYKKDIKNANAQNQK